MNNFPRKHVYRSRVRQWFFISLGFLGAAAFLLLVPVVLQDTSKHVLEFVLEGAPAAIGGLFFALILLWFSLGAIPKALKADPALILSEEGLHYNNYAFGSGVIPWSAIQEFKSHEEDNNNFISVRVNNPTDFLEVGTAADVTINRNLEKLSGTPVNLPTGPLKINHGDLHYTLRDYHRHFTGQD